MKKHFALIIICMTVMAVAAAVCVFLMRKGREDAE